MIYYVKEWRHVKTIENNEMFAFVSNTSNVINRSSENDWLNSQLFTFMSEKYAIMLFKKRKASEKAEG